MILFLRSQQFIVNNSFRHWYKSINLITTFRVSVFQCSTTKSLKSFPPVFSKQEGFL